jgi:hypothetical protein
MPEYLKDKLLKQNKKKNQNLKKENDLDRKNENKSFSIIVRSRPISILTTLATAASKTPFFSVQDIYLNTCSENYIVGDIDFLQNVRPIII